MDPKDLLLILLLFLVFGVPALGLTIRLAVWPVVEAILRLREGFAAPGADERVRRLEAELARLAAAVERLEEAGDFDRRLRGDAAAARALPASGERTQSDA